MAVTHASIRQLSRRYAQALFALCTPQKAADQCLQDLQTLATWQREDAVFAVFTRQVTLPIAQAQAAWESLAKKAGFGTPVASLGRQLIARRRLMLAEAIAEAFEDIYAKSKGEARAAICSATPLSAKQKKALQTALKQVTGTQSVQLEMQTDPTLLGGMTLRVGSTLLDASVSGRLHRLKQQLRTTA